MSAITDMAIHKLMPPITNALKSLTLDSGGELFLEAFCWLLICPDTYRMIENRKTFF
jgi:hypothetical protein